MQDVDGSDQDLERQLAATLPEASAATVRALVRDAGTFTFARGENIVKPTDPTPTIFVVREGIVARLVRGATGREIACGIVGRAELAGVMGLGSEPAATLLAAWSPVRIAAWSPRRLRALIRDDPGLGLDVMTHSTALNGTLAETLDALLSMPSINRLARSSLRYAALVFHEERPALSRGNLASLMGTSREMMDRCLRDLEDRAIVRRTATGGLVLLDRERLAELAGLGRGG